MEREKVEEAEEETEEVMMAEETGKGTEVEKGIPKEEEKEKKKQEEQEKEKEETDEAKQENEKEKEKEKEEEDVEVGAVKDADMEEAGEAVVKPHHGIAYAIPFATDEEYPLSFGSPSP